MAAPQRGALLDAGLRALGGAAEGGESGSVLAKVHRIVAPFARRDHSAIKIEDAQQLEPVKADLECAIGKGDDSGTRAWGA